MSDSFMVAARIPMTRDAFERWLDTATPDLAVIADPGAVFDGWFWDGRRVTDEWDDVEDTTPRGFFAERIDAGCAGEPEITVLLHREGALEAYLFHVGYDQPAVHTAMLLLAGAGALRSGPGEDAVLFWAETSGSLFAPDDEGWLSVLAVGPGGARFVAEHDLTGPVAGLAVAQERFFALVERQAEDEEGWDWDSGDPFRTDTPRDPSFVDPAVLSDPAG
ncbi:hypothetical protein AB0I60_12700 [Actinosynnema sp. NPDC050436]|uniref:hypothetical protein n=1 Tax=Actinosynnema sp. NPDC050436 TaxID=3155659 RepID=UPI0034108494